MVFLSNSIRQTSWDTSRNVHSSQSDWVILPTERKEFVIPLPLGKSALISYNGGLRRIEKFPLETYLVNRIFTGLAIFAAVITLIAFALGMSIGDAAQASANRAVSYHMLAGLAALIVTSLVHAIVLTYFMGTGRWMEETITAYRLSWDFYNESKSLKYRTILLMLVCFLLLITTGAFGAAADPASMVGFRGAWGFSGGTIHMTIALLTWAFNLLVNVYQFQVLTRNGEIVDAVLGEVRRIRIENGLTV